MAPEKIRLTCPQCQASGMAPAHLAGRRVRCRKCGAVVQLPGAAGAAASPPSPTAPARSSPDKEVVFADKDMAGATCPACTKKVFFGDEVVRCAECQELSHAHCIKDRGRCMSAACSPDSPLPGGEGETEDGDQRECPVCAEDIPADAVVCPYCEEHLTGPGGGVPLARYNLPTQFRSAQEPFAKRWDITLRDDELIAASKREELRVLRQHAGQMLELDKRKLIISGGPRPVKVPLDDVGYLSVEHWLTGSVTPRTSIVAKDALISAIVGIFCCQIVLGIYALHRASTAQKAIKAYPELISGQGMVTAAQIIGIVDLVLFALSMLANIAQISQISQM